jgi:hypothetical protein
MVVSGVGCFSSCRTKAKELRLLTPNAARDQKMQGFNTAALRARFTEQTTAKK